MAGTAGYSGTPLLKKLGVTGATPDVVVAFFTERAELERRLQTLADNVFPAGGLWIAWPKKSSGVPTDITEDTIREVALPLGVVDNKVCAIDETWSGLRLVWRKERRAAAPPPGSPRPRDQKMKV